MIQIGDESASGNAFLRVNYSLLLQSTQGLANRSPAGYKLLGQGSLVWQSVADLKLACKDCLPNLLKDFIGNSLVFYWLKHPGYDRLRWLKVEWTDQLYSSFLFKNRSE